MQNATNVRLWGCRFRRTFAPRTQTYFFMAENKKLSIIAFSGDFDKLTAVFTLGTGAAAVGYEVNIFFTFWGLDATVRLSIGLEAGEDLLEDIEQAVK